MDAVAVHPGGVGTPISLAIMPAWCFRFLVGPLMRFFFKTPREGAQTSIYCTLRHSKGGCKSANDDDLYAEAFYADCQPCPDLLYDHGRSQKQRDAVIAWMKGQLPAAATN